MPKTSTTWKPGQSGNPKGRPKGSRDKVNEEFIRGLYADFKKGGKEALERARKERPAEYCRMVASLMPKDSNLTVTNDASKAFLDALRGIGQDARLERENTRLKNEIAALKGEPPDVAPKEDGETKPRVVH